jgi:hypothetical protein
MTQQARPFQARETCQLFVDVDDEPLSVVAVRTTNEESSSLTIRHEGRLLEHAEDFEDDNDNDSYSDYVEMFLFILGLISKVVCGCQDLSKLSGPSRFQRPLNSILIADA